MNSEYLRQLRACDLIKKKLSGTGKHIEPDIPTQIMHAKYSMQCLEHKKDSTDSSSWYVSY